MAGHGPWPAMAGHGQPIFLPSFRRIFLPIFQSMFRRFFLQFLSENSSAKFSAFFRKIHRSASQAWFRTNALLRTQALFRTKHCFGPKQPWPAMAGHGQWPTMAGHGRPWVAMAGKWPGKLAWDCRALVRLEASNIEIAKNGILMVLGLPN